MIRMLFAIDDSPESSKAIDVFLAQLGWYREKPEIHLLNVQRPLRGDISGFLKPGLIEQYHLDESRKVLTPAKQRLENAGLLPTTHAVVGKAAETILRYATEHACQQIMMGSRALGAGGGWVLGSTVTRVLQHSSLPVLILR